MDAWADGLNFYLATHPRRKPRVITRFEPWMALSLHRRQHRRRYRDGCRCAELEAFYGGDAERRGIEDDPTRSASRPAPTASPSRRRSPRDGHALLLINPHTSFFFRSELQMTSDEGLNAYGAVTWGQFFVYQGFNPHAGLDAHLERRRRGRRVRRDDRPRRRRACSTATAAGCAPVTATRRSRVPYRAADGAMATADVHGLPHPSRPDRARRPDGKWIAIALMNKPVPALQQSLPAHQGRRLSPAS